LHAYIDTSALVAVAFSEPGHDAVIDKLKKLDSVFSSTLLEAEFMAAAQREGMRDAAARLLKSISFVFPPGRLSSEIDRVLAAGYLRGADVQHLACALFVFAQPQGELFISLDKRQNEVAQDLGFLTLPVQG